MQNYIQNDDFEDELSIDLKKLSMIIWNRKKLILKIILITICAFIVLTFLTPKKYTVTTDLYINKNSNTNLVDINPFIIDNMSSSASGGLSALMAGGANSGLNDEIDLIQSQLVIDDVIRENDLRYPKKRKTLGIFKIFKHPRAEQYINASDFIGKGKNPKIINKKGSNIITISYIDKNPEMAYNIVKSISDNYVMLHKELHSEKAQSDINVLEEEYFNAKEELDKALSERKGIPPAIGPNAMHGVSTLNIFSKSANSAMSSLNAQITEGQKSEVEITEAQTKVEMLAKKLEWLKLVDKYSDTSKVMVIKNPILPLKNEYSSPNFIIFLILGTIIGVILSIIATFVAEKTDRKLSYSMLGNNVLYNINDLNMFLFTTRNQNISAVFFDNMPSFIEHKLKNYPNINIVKADISEEFTNAISNSENVIIISSIGDTDSKLYKNIIIILKSMNKKILEEILI